MSFLIKINILYRFIYIKFIITSAAIDLNVFVSFIFIIGLFVIHLLNNNICEWKK